MGTLSKMSEARAYFDAAVARCRGVKVKAVFSLFNVDWGMQDGCRSYAADSELFILLEDGRCFVLSYRYIDSLTVELRRLTDQEAALYRQEVMIKDLFNGTQEIHTHILGSEPTARPESLRLEYDEIRQVVLSPATTDYEKWGDGNATVTVTPGEEVFDELRFFMANGKSFAIWPGDVMNGGNIQLRSEDAVLTAEPLSSKATAEQKRTRAKGGA